MLTREPLLGAATVEQNVKLESPIKGFLNSIEVASHVDLIGESECIPRMGYVGLLVCSDCGSEFGSNSVDENVWSTG